MAEIKAIKTTVDGITFRSRLEATWFLYFKELGLNPFYEPETFEIKDIFGGKLGLYVPDFFLKTVGSYIEIKPDRDNYPKRDKDSMCMAFILGYKNSTIVIQGSPFEYKAFEVNDRRKGCPSGFTIEFDFETLYRCGPVELMGFYPDEAGFNDWIDPRTLSRNYMIGSKELTAACWNQTAWNLKPAR